MGKDGKDRIRGGDAVISVLLALLCLFVLLQSRQYSPETARFPQAVAGGTLALSGWRLFRYAAAYGKRSEGRAVSGSGSKVPDVPGWKGISVVLAGVGYAALLPALGFILSTFLVMMVLPPLLGYRKHRITVVTALLFTLILYGFFSVFLTIPLPKGIL